MISRLTRSARTFAVKHKVARMAIIGNNPKVPALIKEYGLGKYVAPVYFGSEAEMMKPGDYDSALVVSSNPKQMEEFLKVQKGIKWVHSTMAGVDWIIGDRLRNSDIVLTNAKGAFSLPLAEHVLFSLLYFAKKTPYFAEKKQQHQWAPIDVNIAGNMTVGIIGYGDIGYNVAKILRRSIQPKILACCKEFNEIAPKQRLMCDSLYQSHDYANVLRESDFVVGILPKTKETTNFFDLPKFKMMKPSAVFMNIGRGVTMVEKDLVTALKEGIISGSALDVYPQEPLPPTSELYDLKNVLMTYHCADRTPDYWERTMKVFAKELKQYAKGLPFKNVIAKEKGYQLSSLIRYSLV